MSDDEELARILSSGKIIEIGDDLMKKDITIAPQKEIKIIKPDQYDLINDEVGVDYNIRLDPVSFQTFYYILSNLLEIDGLQTMQRLIIEETILALEKTNIKQIENSWSSYKTNVFTDSFLYLFGIKKLLEKYEEQDYSKLKSSVEKKVKNPDFNFLTSFKISVFNEVSPIIYNGVTSFINGALSLNDISESTKKDFERFYDYLKAYDFNTLKKEVNEMYKSRFDLIGEIKLINQEKKEVLMKDNPFVEVIMAVSLLITFFNTH